MAFGDYFRKRMAEALGRIGNRSALAPLTEALKDSDLDVQKAAAEAIKRIQKPAPLQAM